MKNTINLPDVVIYEIDNQTVKVNGTIVLEKVIEICLINLSNTYVTMNNFSYVMI